MEYLTDLEKICKINSFTQNKKGVDDVASVMCDWLSAIGFELKTYEREHIGNHQLFTSPKTDGDKILFLGHNDTVFPEGQFDYKEDICKVSIVGVGMKSHTGVASKAFTALADNNINIRIISTSEIKVSMIIEEKYAELAVRSLHDAYQLDQ
jgi:aspartokinase